MKNILNSSYTFIVLALICFFIAITLLSGIPLLHIDNSAWKVVLAIFNILVGARLFLIGINKV